MRSWSFSIIILILILTLTGGIRAVGHGILPPQHPPQRRDGAKLPRRGIEGRRKPGGGNGLGEFNPEGEVPVRGQEPPPGRCRPGRGTIVTATTTTTGAVRGSRCIVELAKGAELRHGRCGATTVTTTFIIGIDVAPDALQHLPYRRLDVLLALELLLLLATLPFPLAPPSFAPLRLLGKSGHLGGGGGQIKGVRFHEAGCRRTTTTTLLLLALATGSAGDAHPHHHAR
mmetsp:Transcript_28734/g.83342  ORF Transcript_28734/g.83342 Transcript_28734/m.83342 type:complete len:229 (+) Transcript_28734:169-855(+)